MLPTLFLITSTHRGWRRLRPLLERCPDLHLMGETQCSTQAVLEVTRLQPAALLVAADVKDHPFVSLIQHLHEASATSKIIVLGDEASLERSTLLALRPLVAAYLMWADLRAETVPRCLAVVVEDNLVVSSRAVLDLHFDPRECRQGPPDHDIVLSERHRMILKGLAAGLTHKEIARCTSCSERTVDREIITLQDKLRVCSEFTLGMKAAQLGFVS